MKAFDEHFVESLLEGLKAKVKCNGEKDVYFLFNTIFLLVAIFTTLFVIKERRKRVEKKATSKKIVLFK
jgi:hypothetical protein